MNNKVLLIICTLFTITIVQEVEGRRKINYCQLDSFFDCFMYSLARFTHQTNGTGIPKNDEEFEELCSMFHDVQPYCLKKYSERCASQIGKELFLNVWARRLQESYKKFCDAKLPTRIAFVKHAKCLIEKVKLNPEYRNDCVRKFQANNEFLGQRARKDVSKPHSFIRYTTSTCCIYNQWENCIVKHLRKNCGDEAANEMSAGDVFPLLIHHSTIMLPVQLCPKSRFNPDDENSECVKEDFVAPSEYVPKGLKSKSFTSYFFSFSCPNVGFGVDEWKDH